MKPAPLLVNLLIMSDNPQQTPPSTPPSTPSHSSAHPLLLMIVGVLFVVLLIVLIPRLSGSRQEILDLGRLKTEKETLVNRERERLGLSPIGSGSSIGASQLAEKVSSDSNRLATLILELQNRVTKSEHDILEKEEELKASQTSQRSLLKSIDQLEQELLALRNSSAEANSLQQKVTSLEELLSLTRRQLAESPSEGSLKQLQQQLTSTQSERDSYQQQLRELQSQANSLVDPEEINRIKEALAKLTPENRRLRYELQKVRAQLDKGLFVESADELTPAAKKLYTELSQIEGTSQDDRIRTYDRLNRELRASVIETVSFPTGESQINFEKVDNLRKTLQSSRPKSFFLVVGYASKTGGIDINRKLSSKRATVVSSVVNSQKETSQSVQGVFLGQTDRFSSSNAGANQICEIWEIRP